MFPFSKFQSSFSLILLSFTILSSSRHGCDASTTGDQETIILINSQLSDPYGALASWSNSSNAFCKWRGVRCDDQTHVTMLALDSLGLTGPLPPSIANLTFLQSINLSGNNFYGQIPSEFDQLTRLEYLNLSNNFLKGEIPPMLFNIPSLISIDLSKNSLNGTIPPFEGNLLPPLMYLSLKRNNLTGVIPKSLGNISSLTYLDLSDNFLEGSIPEILGINSNLQHLDLSMNYLLGDVPNSLYNITSLSYFNLGYNSLTGTIPFTVGYTLPYIQTLNLGVNQFTGPVPSSLSNASNLQKLVLGANSLDGEVPNNLGSLHNLSYLDLGWNQLESGDWSFLSSLTYCKKLRYLNLMGNNLNGNLPNTVGNLSTQLEILLMGNNNISGTIPFEIGNLVNLTALYLDRNLLTGIVPPTIGSLRNLQTLQLSTNMLSGPIPSSIGNLTQLSQLWLMENQFNGTIPKSIGKCKNLLRLRLCRNNLEGIIPEEIFRITTLSQELDLSNNFLEGTIPLEVGSLINLPYLDLSGNKLHGEIPPTLGKCQILQELRLSANRLQGIIPDNLKKLKGIKRLDLSQNNLSGKIPKYFDTFQSLEYLNLSFNALEGEVPEGGIFTNASAVSLLGNIGLCSGNPLFDLPACSMNSSKHKLNKVKIALITIGSIAIFISILVVLFGTLYRLKERDTKCQVKCFDDGRYRRVSYNELVKATDGFSVSNFIGSGSFGSVYKGNLDGDDQVAVKVFDLDQTGAQRSFTAECESLRNIRHRNLVSVITSCSTLDSKGKDFKALVFKYVPNGSLEEGIHPKDQGEKLSLAQRISVAFDMASALSYLHHQCMPPLVHCDLKPSNVLIDGHMNALVSDFGLARFLPDFASAVTQSATSLIGLKGTIGYIAPEYAQGGQISVVGDVYSYGIVLLEMLTGKRPTSDVFNGGLNLHSYVNAAFPEKIEEILDPTISEEIKDHLMHRCVTSLLRIGLSCSNEAPKDRISMRDVATEISSIKEAVLASGEL
ncbi:putative LRR receptor-like serine/threonine-protein kinase [Carex littledalei]|uniref:Receptor kinase-like protein Xa21 n=1 Tax=Carex littledalei TaxID=544730 RepID=A0A833QYC0_9POAL|nr:putative LRR receptor-like serine/threonine-protein kinase [Carex littledalei]